MKLNYSFCIFSVIYVTGRLLKAFQIEFNWYHLASWVNITEQWPYRTSWIILYCEVHEDKLDDFTTLKVAYERVKPFIPTSKEVEPHLEIDRDEKKFQTFLSFHRNTLQVSSNLFFIDLSRLVLVYISISDSAFKDVYAVYHSFGSVFT